MIPMILPLATRNLKLRSILPQTRRSRRRPAHLLRPNFRPYLEGLEDRTVPSSVTVLASHLHTAGGLPERLQVAETGTFANGNDFTFNATPGVYHLTDTAGSSTYGSFTVASDGTISGTTGALVASSSTIDFDLTKLAAVTIFGTDLKTATGLRESVGVRFIDVQLSPGPGTDTVYLPAGTFRVVGAAGDYGGITVSANSSGTLAVSATSGAAVATGNTIHFDLTKLAAVTVFGTDLKTAGGLQQAVGVDFVVALTSGGSSTDTVYLPAGTYRLWDENFGAYGSFIVSANSSGALAVSATSGAAVATGNTIHFDLTRLAAVTIFGTDLKTAAGSQQQVRVPDIVGSFNGITDTVYCPARTFQVQDGSGHVYGTFTVAANASGALVVTGATGAAIATGNTIHFDPCRLELVRITPNSGAQWYLEGPLGARPFTSDIVAIPDGSYRLFLYDSSGNPTLTTFSVSSASGLSATQLPQNSPLATLALVPCVPVVGPITAPLTPVPMNTVINASASFTDGPLETHTAVWNWGDGTTSSGTVTESNGSGTVTGSHAYAVDGVYTITLTVKNNVGGSGQSVFQDVVVYNPSAGFVTGGGWFNSPAGAYAANTSLTGQANFGLNAKYLSGSTVPTGNTEFQFPAANLNFHATSYDWLVITTNQAQYQGSGTINGAGNFGFLVTAQDNGGATPDLFRMKIWDKNNNNAVVYDTQPGAANTAAPTKALGGGRIQVHTNAQLVAGGANPSGGNVVPLTPEELQPIVQEAIAGWRAAGIDPARLSALRHVAVGIAEFPAPWLGMAFPDAIWINRDAAGYGWYIGPTPSTGSAIPASPASPAFGKVDLLTVVEHELGHELGYADTAGDDLMGVFLATGVRRVPASDQAPGNLFGERLVPPVVQQPMAPIPGGGTVVPSMQESIMASLAIALPASATGLPAPMTGPPALNGSGQATPFLTASSLQPGQAAGSETRVGPRTEALSGGDEDAIDQAFTDWQAEEVDA
jgi:hypothetical protein